MIQKWTEPTVDDVKTFMLDVVVDRTSPDGSKVTNALSEVVMRVRGAIADGGMCPLSDNDAEVPKSARKHVLVMTAQALIAGTPNFSGLVKEGFDKDVERAERWMDYIKQNGFVARPENSEDTGFSLMRFGSDSDEFDMTTD